MNTNIYAIKEYYDLKIIKLQETCFDEQFKYLCENGHLKEAKQYLKNNSYKHRVSVVVTNYLLNIVCEQNYAYMALWLLQLNPEINTFENQKNVFRCAYFNCNLGAARRILFMQNNAKNLISSDDEYAFIGACSSPYVNLAPWLYAVCPTINVTENNHMAFKNACKYSRVFTAHWLQKIKPFTYNNILIANNGKICGYVINEKTKEIALSILYILTNKKYKNSLFQSVVIKCFVTL